MAILPMERTSCQIYELLPMCCGQSNVYWAGRLNNHGAGTSAEGRQRCWSVVSNSTSQRKGLKVAG